eukprot:COSAG04_NODE_16504_length_497_cov_0.944724_1_plen_165_part_11
MGGPLWRSKARAWTILKGEPDDGEAPFACAYREFREESGIDPPSDAECYQPLGFIKQSGGKIVAAWCFEGDVDPSTLRSNTFEFKGKHYPEIDEYRWFPSSEALGGIMCAQAQEQLIERAVVRAQVAARFGPAPARGSGAGAGSDSGSGAAAAAAAPPGSGSGGS